MITALVLSPSLDVSCTIDSLRPGEIHRPEAVARVAGGKGLNLARAASVLGADVDAVVLLGGAVGSLVGELLIGDGIDFATVPNGLDTRICFSVAGTERSEVEMTEFYQRATPVTVSPERIAEALAAGEAGTGDWLAFSGGLPEGIEPAELVELLMARRRAGVRIAVDCYGPVLAALLEAGVDLVKINRSEAAELVGEDGDAEQLAVAVAGRSRCPVVVTDGADGSVLVEAGEACRIPASAERGRFPVGSGDSYLGGLLAGLEQGLDLPAAVRLGAGAGTANALQLGAGVLDPAAARRIAGELG